MALGQPLKLLILTTLMLLIKALQRVMCASLLQAGMTVHRLTLGQNHLQIQMVWITPVLKFQHQMVQRSQQKAPVTMLAGCIWASFTLA